MNLICILLCDNRPNETYFAVKMISFTKARKQWSSRVCLSPLIKRINKDNNHVWNRNYFFCGNDNCDDNVKSKPNYIISLKHVLIVAKNYISSSEKEKNRDILKAFELNLHIAVLCKAVEFEL